MCTNLCKHLQYKISINKKEEKLELRTPYSNTQFQLQNTITCSSNAIVLKDEDANWPSLEINIASFHKKTSNFYIKQVLNLTVSYFTMQYNSHLPLKLPFWGKNTGFNKSTVIHSSLSPISHNTQLEFKSHTNFLMSGSNIQTFSEKVLRTNTNLLLSLPNLRCDKLPEIKYSKTVSAVNFRDLMKLLTCIIQSMHVLMPTQKYL